MKAISIRAPWWWCILHAGKRIENRHLGFPRYTGPVLLHASKWWVKRDIEETLEHLILDGAVPSMLLTDPAELADMRALGGHLVGRMVITSVSENGGSPGDYWAADHQLGLHLGDVMEMLAPLPFRGALGLSEVPDSWTVTRTVQLGPQPIVKVTIPPTEKL